MGLLIFHETSVSYIIIYSCNRFAFFFDRHKQISYLCAQQDVNYSCNVRRLQYVYNVFVGLSYGPYYIYVSLQCISYDHLNTGLRIIVILLLSFSL